MIRDILAPSLGYQRRVSASVDYNPSFVQKQRLHDAVLERCRMDDYKQHLLQLRKERHIQRVAKTRLLKKMIAAKSATPDSREQNSSNRNSCNQGSNTSKHETKKLSNLSSQSVHSILLQHKQQVTTRDMTALVMARKKQAVASDYFDDINSLFRTLNQPKTKKNQAAVTGVKELSLSGRRGSRSRQDVALMSPSTPIEETREKHEMTQKTSSFDVIHLNNMSGASIGETSNRAHRGQAIGHAAGISTFKRLMLGADLLQNEEISALQVGDDLSVSQSGDNLCNSLFGELSRASISSIRSSNSKSETQREQAECDISSSDDDQDCLGIMNIAQEHQREQVNIGHESFNANPKQAPSIAGRNLPYLRASRKNLANVELKNLRLPTSQVAKRRGGQQKMTTRLPNTFLKLESSIQIKLSKEDSKNSIHYQNRSVPLGEGIEESNEAMGQGSQSKSNQSDPNVVQRDFQDKSGTISHENLRTTANTSLGQKHLELPKETTLTIQQAQQCAQAAVQALRGRQPPQRSQFANPNNRGLHGSTYSSAMFEAPSALARQQSYSFSSVEGSKTLSK